VRNQEFKWIQLMCFKVFKIRIPYCTKWGPFKVCIQDI